jgi:hypothetical protein
MVLPDAVVVAVTVVEAALPVETPIRPDTISAIEKIANIYGILRFIKILFYYKL